MVQRWVEQRVNAIAIHAALSREHGYRGSYSSVYRMVIAVCAMRTPEATVANELEPEVPKPSQAYLTCLLPKLAAAKKPRNGGAPPARLRSCRITTSAAEEPNL